MTARWVDDEPVPYDLTANGWAAVTASVTAADAAEVLGLTAAHVGRLASRGEIAGVKVRGTWVLERISVEGYPRRRAARLAELAAGAPERVDAGPLLAAVAARGGPAACGVRPGSADQAALWRARREGTLTVRMADRLSVRLLGLTAWEVADL